MNMVSKFRFTYCAVFGFIAGAFSIAYHFYGYTPVQDDFIELYGVAVTYVPLLLVVMGCHFYYQFKSEIRG
tara:strand:+ start:1258 stop:1470 length:213 start_codon:yes stop_codon:yes gene_type:complete